MDDFFVFLLQVMKKDLDNKEKYTLKLMGELQELKGRYEECERQRNGAITQLEDAVRRGARALL